MMNKIGHLRALGLAVLMAGGCGDDKQETTSGATDGGTTSGTESASSATDVGTGSTTEEPTPTTTTMTTDPGTTGDPTTEEPTTGDDTGGEGACDPIKQDCPEGSKCTSYGKRPGDEWNANKCVPLMGDGQYGDDCSVMGDDMFSGIDDCGVGFICLSVDDQLKGGACAEYCSVNLDCPNTSNGDGLCLADANEGTLPICLALCDPLAQDCPGNGGCYGDDVNGPPGICFFPDPKDGGMDGGSCNFTNACLPGFNCQAAATQEGCVTEEYGCCAPFCDLTDVMPCGGAEECVPFYMMEYPGYENVGICALPG